MKKLFTYGCSYTAGWYANVSLTEAHYIGNNKFVFGKNYYDYFRFRGDNLPPTYIELLADEYNLQLNNFAEYGSSNGKIFYKGTETSNKWEKDDIILFQTTHTPRYHYPHISPQVESKIIWTSINPNPDFVDVFSKETQQELLVSRELISMNRETVAIVRAMKGLADSKGCKFLWVPMDQRQVQYIKHYYEEHQDLTEYWITQQVLNCDRNETYITQYFPESKKATIVLETNGKIVDYHCGEIGHKLQSEIISPYLRKFL